MKALSIKQPWAHLIMEGHQDVLNRKVKTDYRGPFIVHVKQNYASKDEYQMAYRKLFKVNSEAIYEMPAFKDKNELVTGKCVGLVTLTGVVAMDPSPWFDERFGGIHGYKLKQPVRFPEPFDYRGQIGFFEVENDVLNDSLIEDYFESLNEEYDKNLYLKGEITS